MIEVTRLNGQKYWLNAIHIEGIEELPDTYLTLTNGKKIVVQESREKIVEDITNDLQKIGLLASYLKSQPLEGNS